MPTRQNSFSTPLLLIPTASRKVERRAKRPVTTTATSKRAKNYRTRQGVPLPRPSPTRRKSSNEPLDQAHLLGKIEIAVAPRWTLSLLGDTYVVRRPLRSDWNHAWFMTEQDSLRLDKDIYQLLQGTSIAVDKVKIESKKRLIAKGIEDLVTREAKQCS